MSSTRPFRTVATGARILTGVVIAAACAAGVVAAVHLPWPESRSTPAQAEVAPLPGDSVAVCNGDFRAIGRDTADALAMSSAGSPQFVSGGTAGEPAMDSISADDVTGAGEIRRLTGAVEARKAPLIAGAESIVLAGDDLAGLAALPCGATSLESWIVGGTAATGATDIIVLSNPGDVPSTVDLTVYGTTPAHRTVIVPAASQIGVPLASLAAGEQAPVVKIATTGAAVRAVLQSSRISTLDPSGIDLQGAVSGPQRDQVIPGVQAWASAGDDAEATVLRLFAADADAQAVVRVLDADGALAQDPFTVPLTAGAPAEVSLAGLEPGTYTVEIEADNAVLAGVRQQDGGGNGSDFTWSLPAPMIDADTMFSVPDGPTPTLHLVNDGDADVIVDLLAPTGGEERAITVAAGGSAQVVLSAGMSYLFSTTGEVHAAMTMTATGQLASWPIQPAPGAERSITVFP